MQQAILTGVIQGITEWLPLSSEGILAIIKNNFFYSDDTSGLFRQILFLHLGTFLAATLYFRKEVLLLLKAVFYYRQTDTKTQKTLIFLILSTFISGLLGIILLKNFIHFYETSLWSSKILNVIIGILLLITAFFQIKIKAHALKNEKNLLVKDAMILGLVQAFAVLPGLSRSGLTISFLLLRKFNKQTALRLSFLMSLPIVLGGNIFLNLRNLHITAENLVALSCSFIVGLLTIKTLFKIAEKINFGYFVLFFAALILAFSLN
jgi:undecaprenyl-diphosphatase